MQHRLSSLTEQGIPPVANRNVREETSALEVSKTESQLELGQPPELIPGEASKPRYLSQMAGYLLLGIGLITLTASIMVSSTILTFIGLGLAFWGMLAFFVQPQKYVRTDLMDATAVSSLKTIDKMLIGIGYREKGVYIPAGEEKAVVFVPFEPFSAIPKDIGAAGDETFIDDPRGMLVVPPGLALASLIEKKLGFSPNRGVQAVLEALPKVLVEDLEIVRDVEVRLEGDKVHFKLVDSIYADFCREMRDTSRRCGLGCPMCSALACILATASGKPVVFEEDELLSDKKTTYSTYELLTRPRL